MVKSVCPFCAVGCGQDVYVSDGKVVQIEGDDDSPISRGRLCPKGSASKQLVTNPGRPEIETGEMRTEDIGTEVFFFPAANHVEKKGTFTNTQRLLRWRHQAVEPPGDARSELWFYYHLGRRLKEWPGRSPERR